MRTIVDYKIVVSASVTNLETKVKNLMEDGWQPLGGSAPDNTQTMVKYEKDELFYTIREAIIQSGVCNANI